MKLIIQDVKTELLALRALVDNAIAHVEAGVNNLNEDQIELLGDLVDGVAERSSGLKERIGRIFGGEEASVGGAVTGTVGDSSPSGESSGVAPGGIVEIIQTVSDSEEASETVAQ